MFVASELDCHFKFANLVHSDSEAHGNLQPISPHALSVSPDGHVLCTLDTASRAGPGGGEREHVAGARRVVVVRGAARAEELARVQAAQRGARGVRLA